MSTSTNDLKNKSNPIQSFTCYLRIYNYDDPSKCPSSPFDEKCLWVMEASTKQIPFYLLLEMKVNSLTVCNMNVKEYIRSPQHDDDLQRNTIRQQSKLELYRYLMTLDNESIIIDRIGEVIRSNDESLIEMKLKSYVEPIKLESDDSISPELHRQMINALLVDEGIDELTPDEFEKANISFKSSTRRTVYKSPNHMNSVFSLVPNELKDLFSIKLNDDHITHLRIYDITRYREDDDYLDPNNPNCTLLLTIGNDSRYINYRLMFEILLRTSTLTNINFTEYVNQFVVNGEINTLNQYTRIELYRKLRHTIDPKVIILDEIEEYFY